MIIPLSSSEDDVADLPLNELSRFIGHISSGGKTTNETNCRQHRRNIRLSLPAQPFGLLFSQGSAVESIMLCDQIRRTRYIARCLDVNLFLTTESDRAQVLPGKLASPDAIVV